MSLGSLCLGTDFILSLPLLNNFSISGFQVFSWAGATRSRNNHTKFSSSLPVALKFCLLPSSPPEDAGVSTQAEQRSQTFSIWKYWKLLKIVPAIDCLWYGCWYEYSCVSQIAVVRLKNPAKPVPRCKYRVLLEPHVWFDLSKMSSATPDLGTELHQDCWMKERGNYSVIWQYFTNEISGQASKLLFNQLYLF